jgi:Cu+-exporting ATPase
LTNTINYIKYIENKLICKLEEAFMSKKTLLIVVLFLVASVALVMAVDDKKASDDTLKCPVSGMEFTKSEASPEYEYKGKTYYFCCAGCKDKFEKDPEAYIKNTKKTEQACSCDSEHDHQEHADHAEREHEHVAEQSHSEHTHAESAKHDQPAHAEHAGHSHVAEHAHAEEGAAIDPVCGMKVKKEDAKFTHVHNDKTYYFCNEGCKDKFVKAPGNYIRADEGIVTCPVSGESFKKSEFTESMDYEGTTYYFCCTGCKDKFEKSPEKYAKK